MGKSYYDDQIQLHAQIHTVARCPKHHIKMKTIRTGFIESTYNAEYYWCDKCEELYEIKLVQRPKSRYRVEEVKKQLEEDKSNES